MPGWVVPAVAAELWGVSVEHVLAEVADGRLLSRVEGDFLFVDVDPATQAPHAEPRQATNYRRSLAWFMAASQPIVTAAERDALLNPYGVAKPAADDQETPGAEDDAPPPMALTDDDVPNWDEVRACVARTRRPPAAIREAA